MKMFRVNYAVTYEVEAEDKNSALERTEEILTQDLSESYVIEILGSTVEEI